MLINKKKWNNSTSIQLPSSKSLSNRALVIQALCEKPIELSNLSDADDTVHLKAALTSKLMIRNVGEAGTALRFCAALFSILHPENLIILTGAPRLRERPIAPLVDALRKLGADIVYADKEGFAPLQITSKELQVDSVEVDASMSSQFISALCMIAPKLKNGLIIYPQGNLMSEPYIMMTLQLMKYFGIQFQQSEKSIQVSPQHYTANHYTVENDWSAASFFYAGLVIQDSGTLFISGLSENSLQGDSAIVNIAQHFGISTIFKNGGIELSKSSLLTTEPQLLDMTNYPDIAIPFIVVSAIKYPHLKFTGLSTLLIKESNRIEALQKELSKFGLLLTYQNDILSFNGQLITPTATVTIATHNDHRIAMAMSLLSLVGFDLEILNEEVVNKSFPNYWVEFGKC